jgi:glutathione S-transferase
MIRLCGFPVSNYYNKVKFALLEKGLPFEEEYVGLGRGSVRLEDSPARKIPFLEDGDVRVVESQVMLEYLEDAYPQVPLLPRDPVARSHCRELMAITELYLELPARRLYPQAFFGGSVSEDTRSEAARELERGVHAFERLVRFSPFAAGEAFTLADCTLAVHLPLVKMASKRVLGADVLADVSGIAPWLALLGERPSFQRVSAERKAGEAAMAAHRAARNPS